METQQLPSPAKQEYEQQHPYVILALIGAACTWVLVFVIGIGIAKGGWASWWSIVGLGAFAALCIGTLTFLEQRKKHQLHKENLKDRAHHRKMTELAIVNDHSAEHVTETSSFRTISKYMGPASSVTIRDNNMGQAQLAAGASQPRLETVIQELTDNTLEFAFGTNRETGQIVKSSLEKAVHLNSIGDSGGGKSMGATGILTALAATNDQAHLQLAFIDAESETTIPFQRLPHIRFLADDPRDAARILAELVRLKRQRDITKQRWPFILLFCEEFLVLRKTMPESVKQQALDDFTELACTGRKRHIALYTVGQTAYSDKAIRDAQAQFQTNMAYSIHPQRARAAGFIETPYLNTVYQEKKPGQFVLEHKGENAIILAPHIDMRAVSKLLVPSEFPVSSGPVPNIDNHSNGSQDGQHPELENGTLGLVRKMVVDEKGVKEIAAAAFPNMRDIEAVKEVRRYLAQLVRESSS